MHTAVKTELFSHDFINKIWIESNTKYIKSIRTFFILETLKYPLIYVIYLLSQCISNKALDFSVSESLLLMIILWPFLGKVTLANIWQNILIYKTSTQWIDSHTLSMRMSTSSKHTLNRETGCVITLESSQSALFLWCNNTHAQRA